MGGRGRDAWKEGEGKWEVRKGRGGKGRDLGREGKGGRGGEGSWLKRPGTSPPPLPIGASDCMRGEKELS